MSNTTFPRLLITGATGNTGTELTKTLSAKNISFRVMVRSPKDMAKFSAMPGAIPVIADFDDPRSITRALDGIEKAFLLTPSTERAEMQQKDFINKAVEAGVHHIVKLSQLHASKASPVRFLRYHAAVEEGIQLSGMAYTFLRPNLFMQGLLGFRETIIHQGKFFASAGNAAVSLVDVRDIAAVAACTLTEKGHENKVYDITGPQALTHEDIAAMLTEQLGREVCYVDVAPDQMLQAVLSLGFPQWQAEGLIEDYAHYARGEASGISAAVQQVTGREPRSFHRFVHEHLHLFS